MLLESYTSKEPVCTCQGWTLAPHISDNRISKLSPKCHYLSMTVDIVQMKVLNSPGAHLATPLAINISFF